MSRLWYGLVAASTLFATNAFAQVAGVDLNGPWICVSGCTDGRHGVITQNGWQVEVLTSRRTASHGWVEYPGRIWLEQANTGIVYTPDGTRLQSDRGSVWVRP